jgi:hypothetical protein
MIRHLTAMLLLLAASVQLTAQEAPQIAILLAQVNTGKDIPYAARDRANRQILSALEMGDAGAGQQFSAFVIKPTLDILEQGKIEGTKTQQTVKLNLQLQLTNVLNGDVLAVQDVKISGAGNNLDEAVNRALQGLKRDHPGLSKAVSGFRQRVTEHYQAHCASVTGTAEELAAQNKFREAFLQLHAVPRGTDCYASVAEKKQSYFQSLQQAECDNRLQKARAAIAGNQYATGLSLLSQVDANAPCFNEAKTLIAQAEGKLDDELKTRYEWLLSFYREGRAAETARWNAMTAYSMQCLRESGKYILVERQ